MKSINRLLLVEDNPGDARLLREMFNEPGSPDTDLTHVECIGDAEKYLAERAVDVILLDLGLPDANGLNAVQRIHARAPRVPLVVLTGMDDEELAGQALQGGAQDYLVKGQIETRGLLRALRYAMDRKIKEEALFAEKERAQVTLDCIGDAVACTDSSGHLTFLNLVAEKMTGWSWKEASGRSMAEVIRILDATSREIVPNPMEMEIGQERSGSLPANCVLVRRDGCEIPIEDSVAPIRNREGKATGAVIVFRDVSAARAKVDQIAHAAQHDYLTGLPNRMLLNDRLKYAIALAGRHQSSVAVLFLDLDGFKHVNDSLGHPAGDQLLQSVAQRLVACLRTSDTVGRVGGDEFVVLLSEMDRSDDASVAAKRMLRAVAKAHLVGQHDLHITTSIGVSVYPDDGEDSETLIKNADTAMYQAKENGRHTYQFFKPAMNVRAVERQSIDEGLRRALERHEFSLYYQPTVSLRSGKITGAEALLRWMHPTRGPIAPAQFIPIAEDCGLIVPIGHWVLREACRQTKAWVGAGLPLANIAVNISALELRDDQFLEGLWGILADTGLDPSSLELEMTESVLMNNTESMASVFRDLRAKGIQLAVDNFGTGYSSLSHLRKHSIDTLKIDPSFVHQITTAPTLATAVIGMGRSLRLRVVAEGVETDAELEFLRAHRCDEAQGYYFSRPVVAEQFAKLLETGLSKRLLDSFQCEPVNAPEVPSGTFARGETLLTRKAGERR